MVTASQNVSARGQTVRRHAAGVQTVSIRGSHSRGWTSRLLCASCVSTAGRAPVGYAEPSGGEDLGWRASNSGRCRLANRCVHPVRSCRSIGGGPDERSWRETLAHRVGAPTAGPCVKPVKLARKGFTSVNCRSHRPSGYMNGARSRVGSRIGQTEDTLHRR